MSHLNQTLNSITKEIKKMEIEEVNSEMISRLTHMINKINKIQIKLLSLDKENYSSLNQVVGAIQNIIRKNNLNINMILISNKYLFFLFNDMGMGDWGWGIGDWARSPIPNPQSPIPNPHDYFILKV